MIPLRKLTLALAVCAALLGCAEPPPPGPERGRVLFASCTACHGEGGAGNQEYGAPAIAGLDAWYVQTQLEHFRAGSRGAHPDDTAGLRMRPMLQTLRTDDDLQSVAQYIASMPRTSPRPTLSDGDPARGRELYGTCATCHGQDGTGNQSLGAPPLARASDWYLFTQLHNFREGIRGVDPRDTTGATMRPMAMSLTDEQAMRDVIAFIGTLPDAGGERASR